MDPEAHGWSACGRADRGRVDRRVHVMDVRQDLLGEQLEALLGLLDRHTSVEVVHDEHVEAGRLLEGLDLVDDLVGCSDGLGVTCRGEVLVGHPGVGGLADEVLLVALDPFEPGVVPLEVVVLGGDVLLVVVVPALLKSKNCL